MSQKIIERNDTPLIINPEEANDFFNKGILYAYLQGISLMNL